MQASTMGYGNWREISILTRRAGKGNTKAMTFEWSFENESEGIPGQRMSGSKGMAPCILGVLKVAVTRGG